MSLATVGFTILGWLAWGGLMLATMPSLSLNIGADTATEARLNSASAAVANALDKSGNIPKNLAEIRLWGLAADSDFVPYDGYGQRLSYTAFADSHYLLRSFGADEMEQSTGRDLDPSRFKLPPPPAAMAVQGSLEPSSGFTYNPRCLLGLKAERTDLWGVLVPNAVGQHSLVIRSTEELSFVMVSGHSGVEEFLWLADGQTLVFSATESDPYPAGVYLWDLATGETRLLTTRAAEPLRLTPTPRFTTLSHVSPSGQQVHAFVRDHQNLSLRPESLFAIQSIINIEKKSNLNLITPSPKPLTHVLPEFHPLVGANADDPWSSLPRTGEIEEVLNAWQEFAEECSPLELPYALFYLALLYGDAARVLAPNYPVDSATLKTFGAEMARALYRQAGAPHYLRAMGKALYEDYLQGHLPQISIATFVAPSKDPELDPDDFSLGAAKTEQNIPMTNNVQNIKEESK